MDNGEAIFGHESAVRPELEKRIITREKRGRRSNLQKKSCFTLKAKGLVSGSVDRIDYLKYKYLVDVDGNSCSYERYFWLLLSNSLVVKQVTPNIQWYYGGLTSYVHYLPVQEDLSDLVEKIEWARAHDAEAQKMSERAMQFVRQNLASEDILLYMYTTTH